MDKMAINWTLIAQLIMFLTALGILTRFLFKPMLAVFAKRRELTEQPHEDAARLREEALAARKQVEEELSHARHDMDKARNEILAVATRQERETVGEARGEAGKILEAARAELNQAYTDARQRLGAAADELADSVADKLLEIQR